jgi:hypothetical protein
MTLSHSIIITMKPHHEAARDRKAMAEVVFCRKAEIRLTFT